MFKWRILGFLAVLLLGVAFGGCKGQPKEKCIPEGQVMEIEFPYRFWASRIEFSPIEKDKIWLWGSNEYIREIDLKTKKEIPHSSAENEWLAKTFGDYTWEKDPFENYLWIIGHSDQLHRYSIDTKEDIALPVMKVFKIIPNRDFVFFVSENGLYNYDRKTEQIQKDSLANGERIWSAENIDNKSIILNSWYTFDLENRKLSKGANLRGLDVTVYYMFSYQKGILVGGIGDSISVVSPKRNTKKFIYHALANQFIIDSPFVWVFANNAVKRVDIATDTVVEFPLQFPEISEPEMPGQDFFRQIEGDYLWIYNNVQFYLLNRLDGSILECPLIPKEDLANAISDECNIYLLYHERMVIFEKQAFIKQCKPYDAQKHQDEWAAFNKAVDSIGILYGKDMGTISESLRRLHERFANTPLPQITKKLKWLDVNAFKTALVNVPADYLLGLQNKKLPQPFRRYCFYHLMRHFIQNGDFSKVVEWETQYRNELGPLEEYDFEYGELYDKNYSNCLDSVKEFIIVLENLQKSGARADEVAFTKASQIYKLCDSGLFHSTASYDFTVAKRAFQSFLKAYPQSKYADNAAFLSLKCDNVYDNEDEDGLPKAIVKTYVGYYQAILKKYPGTELKADIEWEIYSLYSLSDYRKAITAGKQFVKDFPNDKRAKDVLNEINQ